MDRYRPACAAAREPDSRTLSSSRVTLPQVLPNRGLVHSSQAELEGGSLPLAAETTSFQPLGKTGSLLTPLLSNDPQRALPENDKPNGRYDSKNATWTDGDMAIENWKLLRRIGRSRSDTRSEGAGD